MLKNSNMALYTVNQLEQFVEALNDSELAARFDLHPNMIAQWKCQATDGMAGIFFSEGMRYKKLLAKVSQLIIGRDFLAKAPGGKSRLMD